MKKSGIIIWIIIAITLGVMLPLSMDLIDKQINPPSSSSEEEYIPLDPEFLEKPKDGSTPNDHSVLDNFKIAGGVLSLTENFKTTQEGNCISDVIIKNNQKVSAQRIINGDKAYVSHKTSSTFVESSVQRFYLEDKVLVRNGKFEKDEVIFNDNIEPNSYSYEYIISNLGWLPFSMTSYIVNEDTILSSRVVEDSDFDYTMELILDNEESISSTKREVRYNANAVSYPKYSQVKLTISMDNNWRILEIKNEDIYDITVKMGINMTVPVKSNLVEKFYYEDCLLSSLDCYPYFSKYYNEEIDDEEVIVKEKRAIDYLMNLAFDVLMNGSTFNVKAKLNENNLEGKIDVKLDILNGEGNIIGLFNDFFFKYDSNLYVSYLKHNYSFDEQFLLHLLDRLSGINVDSAAYLSSNEDNNTEELENSLESLISNLLLIKEDNNVTIKGVIEGINFSLRFFEMEQGTILKSITLDGEMEGNSFEVVLTPTNKKIEYVENEYNDLSSSTWLVDELIELNSYQGYTLHFDYPLDNYDLDVDINLLDSNKVKVDFIIGNENKGNKEISIYYIDQVFYLELEEYIVSLTEEDILILIDYVKEYLSSNTPETISLSEDTPEEESVLQVIYNVLGVISMTDENTLNVPLYLSYIDESLKDSELNICLIEDDLMFSFVDYNVDMTIKEYIKDVVLPVGKPIYSKESLEEINTHISNINSLINSEGMQIEFNDVVINSENTLMYADGKYLKNNDNYLLELELVGDINMMLRVVYLNSKYYLSFGENSYSINFILNEKQMETFIEYIDEIFSYIFDENQFDVSLETFIGNIFNMIKDIINGNVDTTIGDLIYEFVSILDSSYIEIDERNIIVEYQDTQLQLFKLSNNYMLMIDNFNYQDTLIEGDIYIKERNQTINIDSQGFIDISEIFEDLGIVVPNEEQ